MPSYAQSVVGSNPLFYWQMNETGGTTLAPTVGAASITLGTLTAKPTLGVAGATPALGNAVLFDGVNDFAQAALNLSAYSALALEFWLWWDAYAADDHIALEFCPDGSTNGSFYVDPNFSVSPVFVVNIGNVTNANSVPRPSAAAWHHIVISMDRTGGAGTPELPYVMVDGVAQTITNKVSGDNAGNFTNNTLNLMCRNAASLFGAGKMQHLAIYSSLTQASAQAHYANRNNTGANQLTNRGITRGLTRGLTRNLPEDYPYG